MTEPKEKCFPSEEIKRQIIDEYLQLQIEFAEETLAECNQEISKRNSDTWYTELKKQENILIFLRELQRRERNGL